jgi:hypothetical protein
MPSRSTAFIVLPDHLHAIWSTGDLEITLSKPEDLERAMPLIKRSYEAS